MIWIFVLQVMLSLLMVIPLYLMFKEVGHVREYVSYLKITIERAKIACQALQDIVDEQKQWKGKSDEEVI